jgi:hypothetical protein
MWRWADEQGEQRLVSAEELRTAIASGVLPLSTLVWREGMDAWVAAASVPEFASAVASGNESRTADVSPGEITADGSGANPAQVGPSKSTLQGMHAREIHAAVTKGEEKPAPQAEKRTPSVAPPRPAASPAKPPLVKTLRPNYGPAVPAAPRLPAEVAPKAAIGPRPGLGPKPAAAAPVAARTPAAAPAARAPSTSAIDKDWSIADDETTNVPGKTTTSASRPEPPPESPAAEVPNPQAVPAQTQPSRGSVIRSTPPPSPHAERRPSAETTESTTFQFAKNTLSLRALKPPVGASGGAREEAEDPGNVPDPTERIEVPAGLGKSFGKQPGRTRGAVDDPPPTAPSADLGLNLDDGIPAYAQTTTRLDSLPVPPKMREPTATTMLPIDYQQDEGQTDEEKALHQVSRTIRLSADFLSQVKPGASGSATKRVDPTDPEVRNAMLQMKPPPLPPPQDPNQPFVRLQPGQPHAATSLALRAVQPPGEAPPQLPLNALLLSGAMLITMVIGAFFVGRCSVKPAANNVHGARTGFANAVRFVEQNLPKPPKPCWVVKQPARWAPVVSKNVPFELLVKSSGKIAIGYAKSDDEAVGIEVTPMTGQVEEDYVDKASSDIARVTPLAKGFFISTVEPAGSLKSLIPVLAEKPFYLGISEKHVAWADQPSGAANRIWPISDEDTSGGIHLLSLGNQGVVAALRAGSSRQKKAYVGLLGADRKPITNLVNVAGSGGLAGEPMVGANGREIAVVFADQAGEQSPWKMRLGHAPIGKIPASAAAFETPAGGPGGDANYPSIGGLGDGRWVLVWTEGSSSTKSVRAQTLGANFAPVGDPIVLSPPSGNYSTSMIGVVNSLVTVVFVQKGKSNNELWGAVLQCG